MNNRDEARDFLASRRAKITPQQAGLTAYGANRRVPGLRREEVAMLAGLSSDYYVRLERGNLTGVSESVLEAIANALQLDEAERAHLHDLARAAGARPKARRRAPARVPTSVQVMLDAMTGAPAVVRNDRLDIVATNALGRALYTPLFTGPAHDERRPANHARFAFLDPAARDFWVNWERAATTPSASCEGWPAVTRTTWTSTTSSASCPPAARSSAIGGPAMTCICTAAGSNRSTTPSSGGSN